jgi:hypothetical protein
VSPRPDAPPIWIRLGTGSRVSMQLPDWPGVTWTVRPAVVDGLPRVRELHAQPLDGIDPGTPLPLRRLATAAARALNLGPDGRPRPATIPPGGDTLGSFGEALAAAPLEPRPRRNNPRHVADPAAYRTAMTRWTAPIAEVMRTARVRGQPIRRAVAAAYNVSEKRAEQLIDTARDYHDLPKQPRPPKDTQ